MRCANNDKLEIIVPLRLHYQILAIMWRTLAVTQIAPCVTKNSIMVNMVNGTRTLIAMSESHISECTIRPLLEVWRIVLL